MYDIVIVGAGLSGLSAAHLLLQREAKLKLLILEGKERVGGRTVTQDVPAAGGLDRWDLGGQWVASSQTHVMQLIEELGLVVYPQYTEGKKVHHMGGPNARISTYTTSIPSYSPLVLLDFLQFIWKIGRLCKSVDVQEPWRTPDALRCDAMTLSTYIEQHVWTTELKEEMALCSRAVFGVEPSQMSLLFFLMYSAAAGGVMRLLETTPGAAQEFRVKGGTQQLSECLAERIGTERVRLNSPVMAIWQGDDSVEVRTPTESFSCRLVIVTCPPHMAARLQYQPALPTERQQLCQHMPVGHMIKFIITYPTAFWREKGFSGEIVTRPSNDCPFSVTYDATSPSGSAALVGFIAGLQAHDWASRKVEERRDAVVSSLVRYLGPEASNFVHYIEKDWGQEPYSGGCPVNVMVPGMLTYFHPSLRRPIGRIHWAGTETATKWCGYMSGAIQSGHRVALEVLARLSPHLLSQEEREAAQGLSHQPTPRSDLWSHVIGYSPLRVTLTLTAITLGATLLLVKPQLRRDVIGQALAWLPKYYTN
ncbi:probable flavin-containing monoamine oxidase A [Alosa sapidissima]|uniref:probable flavin-containing monoamine oxidase A n=1 Tax=Alosa sapidissima TaxID=34773 RepID=UPI001C09A175|nr:probable flavin-containing monoamine oxidase A [Alosa sapidissima]